MKLHQACRRRSKIRLLLQGTSGAGKTMSALLIAKGLAGGKLAKVAMIDTENGSGDLYSNLGGYSVLQLEAPYTPEKYCDAIALCEQAGMEVIVLDSITPEWEHVLDYVSNLPGNSFTAWAKATPRHNTFIDTILRSKCHVICTVRSKTEYVLSEKNGKQVPEKVGMKAIQRDGIEYDFTMVLELDIKHHAVVSKDRTGRFMDRSPFVPAEETGKEILEWCLGGAEELQPPTDDEVRQQISESRSLQELTSLYNRCTEQQQTTLRTAFQQQKQVILQTILVNQLSTQTNNNHGKRN